MQSTPKQVVALAGQRITAVEASDTHSLMVTASGTLYSCCNGLSGQLGHGDQLNCHEPTLVTSLQPEQATGAAAAGQEGCGLSFAITAAGHVFSWGFAGDGCLGYGDDLDACPPLPLSFTQDPDQLP